MYVPQTAATAGVAVGYVLGLLSLLSGLIILSLAPKRVGQGKATQLSVLPQ